MIDKELILEIKEIIQSTNINFLLGSGVSNPFLIILDGIENNINNAIKNGDLNSQIEGYKEYLEKVMLPNKSIVVNNFKNYKNFKWDSSRNEWKVRTTREAKNAYENTKKPYINFFQVLAEIILERKTTLLSKQINIFTTNIDIFMEKVLEELSLDYNDGFSGRLSPTFSLSNYKKSIFQRSLHFGYTSEIPIFNIIKMHGSLTWKYNKEKKIVYSPKLDHFNNSLMSKTGDVFMDDYKDKILVVNPENAKFSETVLNIYYYELLRSYSTELERENSILFIIGFSMADQHIREITKRVAKSNPTLKIFIFLYSKDNKEEMEQRIEISKFSNIKVIAPSHKDDEEEYTYDLDTITDNLFKRILSKQSNDEE